MRGAERFVMSRHTPAWVRITQRLIPQPDGCWHWAGVIDQQGYGRVGYKGRRSTLVQRAVYDLFNGPIPNGMDVDHTCHDPDVCEPGRACLHRRCGNPAHLEAVPPRENGYRSGSFHAVNRRKTKCPAGHDYSPENTEVFKQGARICRTCRIRRAAEYRERRRRRALA